MLSHMSSERLWELVWSCLALIGLLLLLAAAVAVASHYYRRLRRGDSATDAMLNDFHELHDRGELSEEEYKRIKVLLGQRLRKELGPSSHSLAPPAKDPQHRHR